MIKKLPDVEVFRRLKQPLVEPKFFSLLVVEEYFHVSKIGSVATEHGAAVVAYVNYVDYGIDRLDRYGKDLLIVA